MERSNGGSVRWGDTACEEQWGQLEGEVLMKLWHAPTFPLPLHGNVKEERAKSGRGGSASEHSFRVCLSQTGGGLCVIEELVMCCVLS